MSKIDKEFDELMDKWLDSTEHRYNCPGYSEGQGCCLDRQEEGLRNPPKGRQFVKDFINKRLKEITDEMIGKEKEYSLMEDSWEDGNICGYNEKREEIINIRDKYLK